MYVGCYWVNCGVIWMGCGAVCSKDGDFHAVIFGCFVGFLILSMVVGHDFDWIGF